MLLLLMIDGVGSQFGVWGVIQGAQPANTTFLKILRQRFPLPQRNGMTPQALGNGTVPQDGNACSASVVLICRRSRSCLSQALALAAAARSETQTAGHRSLPVSSLCCAKRHTKLFTPCTDSCREHLPRPALPRRFLGAPLLLSDRGEPHRPRSTGVELNQ